MKTALMHTATATAVVTADATSFLDTVDEDVVSRLMTELKSGREEARGIFRDLLKFLDLAAKYPKQLLIPPPLVDEAWHTFIIFTRKYHAYCETHYGKYIHHRPPMQSEASLDRSQLLIDGVEATTRLAKQHFGDHLSDNWDYPAVMTWNCGSSTNDPD